MSTLDPTIALSTCETALRELMTYAYERVFGADWLERVTTAKQREAWGVRAEVEQRARVPKGVAQVPNVGLAYANFYDLVAIVERHWEPLAAPLGKKQRMLPLLEQFDSLRNTIGHSRLLLPFEQDLMSGIAGMVRNQVTLYMSKQDEAGDIYPRIESVTDSFGRRIESATVEDELAGSVTALDVTLHPGEVVTFSCVGVDPQGRDLEWFGPTDAHAVGPSGQPTQLQWVVTDGDVSEATDASIYMKTSGAIYHRFGSWDHRAYFRFRVRPPTN
ncbi:hypothetical protein [Agromyces sp. Soil535]|uniref:hypothetical protein n=1 Tax=Agromyces sp. Soil535 TaxID=1736390 RepID=UPI0006FDC31A|nr:hypothetical protein [Agromyces sp. Soil535]KRE29942.1 hypothetical protein ASG80_18590 [Agromyces sp. Soil535]